MDYYYWHTYNCKLEDGNCAAKEKTHVNSVDELKNQNQKCMDRAETTTTYSYTPSETYSTTCSNNNECRFYQGGKK